MRTVNPWLRWWWAWAVPATLVVGNVVWWSGGRVALVGRGSLLARQVGKVEAEVATLDRQDRDVSRSAAELARLQAGLQALRRDQLGAMRDRLIPFISDVVTRAQEAGLRPERVAYLARPDDKTGLVYFTATYNVRGTYEQIRKCLRSLEASPHFVVIENLGLRSQDPAASLDVDVQLAIGTYFADLDEAVMKSIGAGEVRRGE